MPVPYSLALLAHPPAGLRAGFAEPIGDLIGGRIEISVKLLETLAYCNPHGGSSSACYPCPPCSFEPRIERPICSRASMTSKLPGGEPDSLRSGCRGQMRLSS